MRNMVAFLISAAAVLMAGCGGKGEPLKADETKAPAA